MIKRSKSRDTSVPSSKSLSSSGSLALEDISQMPVVRLDYSRVWGVLHCLYVLYKEQEHCHSYFTEFCAHKINRKDPQPREGWAAACEPLDTSNEYDPCPLPNMPKVLGTLNSAILCLGIKPQLNNNNNKN